MEPGTVVEALTARTRAVLRAAEADQLVNSV